jgi:hypothetical protein
MRQHEWVSNTQSTRFIQSNSIHDQCKKWGCYPIFSRKFVRRQYSFYREGNCWCALSLRLHEHAANTTTRPIIHASAHPRKHCIVEGSSAYSRCWVERPVRGRRFAKAATPVLEHHSHHNQALAAGMHMSTGRDRLLEYFGCLCHSPRPISATAAGYCYCCCFV